MRLTRMGLRSMIFEEIRRARLDRLFEAEGDEETSEKPAEDSPEDSLFSDPGESGDDSTEPEDAGAEDSSDTEGDSSDTEGDESESEPDEDMVPADEAKEDAEEAAEEARKEGAKDAMELQKTISGPLSRAVDAAFNDAIGSVKKVVNAVSDVNEGLSQIASGKSRGMLSRLIFESDQDLEIDLPLYAQRIANLITNYDKILDIEKAIFDAAYTLLSDDDKFGPDVADDFKNILARDYDLSFDHVYDPEKADQSVYGIGSRKPESA
jgi:hypothetical protein